MYTISVTKKVENPKYEEEMKEYKSNNGYGYRNNDTMPERFTIDRHLEVILTDEEYRKVKESIISVFE